MARLPRYFVEDQPQHLIQRGNNREPIFVADNDYFFYLECLEKAAMRHGCEIHAYVLMTNHVHLLATPKSEKSLPKTLQSVGRRYVQHFNRTYDRTGTLWEGRYRATIIDSEAYLLICMRYIELNPVRAEMVAHPGDYPWSSYRANALGEEDERLTQHSIYYRLGRHRDTRQLAYRQLFGAHLAKADLEAIRKATNTAWALGDDRFCEKIAVSAERRVTPQPRGRRREGAN